MNAVITNIIKRLAVIISVFAIAWCLIDPVFADNNSTYYSLNSCENFYVAGRYYYKVQNVDGYDTRLIYLRDPSINKIYGFACMTTDNNGDSYIHTSSSSDSFAESCSVNNTGAAGYRTINNVRYGYRIYNYNYAYNNYLNPNVPIIDTNDLSADNALYYTFGDGAVDPVEPITYGLLDDVGFTTDIAGTGNASTSNRDTISWNPVYDSNGNNIMGASVSIRAVPGHYSADSKQNLFEKVRSDFILDNTDLAVLDTVEVEAGSFSITWGQVISAFSLPFGNFISWFKTDEVFLKQGWIYQIQFNLADYTSEWQTVYTIQSESPADSLHVINSTVIDQDTVNILQQINTVNNSSNIWIINETPVDPDDNYTPPASDDEKPWWAYLLEMINNSIGITNQYINNGTDESQEVVNNIETNNNDLDVTVTEYHDIENDLVTDMNDKVYDLDIEEDLTSDASFLSSARWVTEQFNTIVSNNPIGMILKFSLVLGFVTIFLGRFR